MKLKSCCRNIGPLSATLVQHNELVPELPDHVEDPLPAWSGLPKLGDEQVADAAVLLPRDLQITHKHLLSGRKRS